MNRSGLKLPVRKFSWDHFDSLPIHMKEISWEFNCFFPNSVSYVPPSRVAELRLDLEKKQREACRQAYSPDHPNCEYHFSDADFEL